jgi:hypothetical protein
MIIGIDNGLDGGICAISAFSGRVISYIEMPCLERAGKREIDTLEVYRWIMDLNTDSRILIEEPLKHAKTSQAMRSMGISFGKLLGMCESHILTVEPVEVAKWQKAMLGKVLKGQTKKAALEKAQAFEPEEKWLASPRCRVPHDGIVDAFLIAQYGRFSTLITTHKQQ